mmetsp:Transcript_98683/g.318208  ORF Transcript_98683/g.318208 Transcript_98683/m.318208 type:complete len:228 (+) Transcript_98683:1127-1810(+)
MRCRKLSASSGQWPSDARCAQQALSSCTISQPSNPPPRPTAPPASGRTRSLKCPRAASVHSGPMIPGPKMLSDHVRLETSRASKCRIFLAASSARALRKTRALMFGFAKAMAVLARSCGVYSWSFRVPSTATACMKPSWRTPRRQHAHAELLSCCVGHSGRRRRSSSRSEQISCQADCPKHSSPLITSVANPHNVFERPCEENCGSLRNVSSAIALMSGSWRRPSLA